MSSTRSVIAPPPFAANALTVIPPTPVAGVSYRDPAAGPASSPDGWPYAERVNSAEFNQIMYQLSSLLSIIDKKGILGWSNTVEYTEAGTVFGSDGLLYLWVAPSGPTNGGAKDPISTSGFWAPLSSSVALNNVGAVNLKSSIPAASATAVFIADQITVQTSLSGASYRLANFNKTINISTVGVNAGIGGMDSGAAVANGYVAVYAIYNPATQASALIATNETAGKAPEVYVGGNMPAGYTASCLLQVLPTNASSQFKILSVTGRKATITDVTPLNTSAGLTLALTSLAAAVPKSAIRASGTLAAAATSGSGGVSTTISGFASGLGSQSTAGYSTSPNGCNTVFRDLPLGTAQSCWVTTALAGPGTGLFTVIVKEYEI